MGYTAGTLDLSILGASDSAVKSISNVVKSLNSLSNSVNKINNSQFVFAGQKIEVLFNKISKSINSINVANIENLSSAAKSLASISKIGNIGKMDFGKVAKGFETLSVSISPFLAKVKEAETSLTALYGILSKSSSKKMGSLLNPSQTQKVGLFSLANWTAILYTARRLGVIVGNIATKGSEFEETLNLWEVSMGNELIPQATEFVDKLNEAYGISKKTLMNSQAIFKNMLGSLGQISDETAYQLSEGITQMALDYASLYNVKFEDAMTKFQAALAGQVRPIRSVAGYDITENTLFQLYEQLGGTKTMRQLSRTEKQLLAIYAVFQQMQRSGATGDLERTINSFANQSRVMADAWEDIQTYAGLVFIRTLEQGKVMQTINGMLIFTARFLEKLASSLDSSFGSTENIFSEIENGADSATEATEQLEKKLLGFDKFRSLSSPEEESSLNLDENLINAFAEYETLGEDLANKWLDPLLDKNGELKDSIVAIGIVISGLALGNLATTLFSIVKSLRTITGMKLFSKTGFQVGGALAVSGLAIWSTAEVISNTENALQEIGAVLSGAITVVGAILAFSGINVPLGIALMAGGALSLFTTMAMQSGDISEDIKTVIGVITTILSGAMLVVGTILAFSGANIPLGIGLMIGGASILATTVIPNWDDLPNNIQNIISVVMAILGGALLVIGGILAFTGTNLPLGIALMVLGAASLGTAIAINWNSIVDAMQGPLGGIMAILGGALMVIGAILLFTGVGTGLGLGLLIGGAASLGASIAFNWNFLVDKIKDVWEKIKGFWNEHIAPVFTAEWWVNLGKTCMNGLISGFEAGINGIIGAFESMINWIIGGLNSISFEIPDWLGGGTFGINIPTVSFERVAIHRFKDGGLPDKGSVFVAGEAGAEYVYNMPSGQSGVANIAQIAQATYSGTIKALNDWWGGSSAKSDIPQLTEANATGMYQAVTGVARQYGKGWSKV